MPHTTSLTPAELIAKGYTAKFHPETWQDVGNAESGPKLVGYPAHYEFTLGTKYAIVIDGVVVEEGVYEVMEDFPF